MKDKGIIYDKSLAFAIRMVNLKEYLFSRHENIIAKQILRSGTSIGANYSEALGAESTTDFIHKMKISLKEIYETQYWLDVLLKTNYLDETQYSSLASDTDELIKLFTSSINTSLKKLQPTENFQISE